MNNLNFFPPLVSPLAPLEYAVLRFKKIEWILVKTINWKKIPRGVKGVQDRVNGAKYLRDQINPENGRFSHLSV